MQTFLPYRDFRESARVLDRSRLGKQRVEAWQIAQALTRPDYGWKNHPATKMWQGHVGLLAIYGMHICDEWIRRGYKDSLRPKFLDIAEPWTEPPWLGREDLHASHRSKLLEKLPEWYSQFGWTEEPGMPYVWPAP
jgi:hypothetical protein